MRASSNVALHQGQGLRAMTIPTPTSTPRTFDLGDGLTVTVNAYGGPAVAIQRYAPDALTDVRTLNAAEIAALSFHTAAFFPAPATMSAEQDAATAANQRKLAVYGRARSAYDPPLRHPLHRVNVPVVVE